MADEWTDRLSEYLDDELDARDRRAVESHLAECAECARTLGELREVVARAGRLPVRPPDRDLWAGVSAGIARESGRQGGVHGGWAAARVSVRAWQLAAAAALVAAISGGLAWEITARWSAARHTGTARLEASRTDLPLATDAGANLQVHPVSLADAQYDAAVADLQRALEKGRGRLDADTIAVVERNLQVIDQAIAQAQRALAGDPANSYLNGHLVETRRRKLDLLRRAAALASDTN